SKKDLNLNLVPVDEEPKFAKKKEGKVDLTQGKGIELLTEDAQFEEVRRKSLRDFHKAQPSASGTVTKTAPSAAKIKPSVTNEGTGVKPGVLDVTEEESFEKNDSDDDKTQSDNENESDSEHETDENESGFESDQEENEEDIRDDEEEVKDEFLYDNVDIRLNEPVDIEKGFIQEEGTDAEITNVQQGNENPKISQVIEDAHVTLSTVPQKTEVLVTSSSHSSDLASKFLNFLDIPHTNAEIISPMDVHVHHEVSSQQTPALLTVPVSVITESSPILTTVIPQSLPSFTPPPHQ
ncbi:hypothetical protein Tco_1544941, partial [Tanacetum coccineum]